MGVDQVEDIVKEHEKKQHKKDKKKVQKSLVEVEDVIKKQEKPVITSKGDESKKQQEPAILKDVAEQIEDIIVQHDVRPGLDGHDSVQASMGVVVEQVQEVINSGKHEKIVEKQLVNVVDKMKEIIEDHEKQPGSQGHAEVQNALKNVVQDVHDTISTHNKVQKQAKKVKKKMSGTDVLGEIAQQ